MSRLDCAAASAPSWAWAHPILHFADIVQVQGKKPLRLGVAGITHGDLLVEIERFLVGGERARHIALSAPGLPQKFQ